MDNHARTVGAGLVIQDDSARGLAGGEAVLPDLVSYWSVDEVTVVMPFENTACGGDLYAARALLLEAARQAARANGPR
jgi:hypothetical protein